MKNVDYIIVGCGLAGIAFCEELRANNKSFVVFDNSSQKSSLVAAGLYNPVILKRFSAVWKAKEQLELALPAYAKIEKDLNIKIDHKFRLLRRFASIEEQNLWFSAMDKPNIEPYLSTRLVKNNNGHINAKYEFGEVLQAGRIDTEMLINSYKTYLKANNQLFETVFAYPKIKLFDTTIQYETLRAKHLVFAEGFGIKQNPYFKSLPINGTKGEVLTVKAPDLNLDYAIKASVFIIPLDEDRYVIGSTYNWSDKSRAPTIAGKEEILSKLRSFVSCKLDVIEHVAAIRPTVKDRRPLVGRHPVHHNFYVLNGLGSRGVMIAPYVARKLYNFIEHQVVLDTEINSNRFG